MSERKDDYEVGYGKPPKEHRFTKGVSGNASGRPKGAKGVKASLRRELETKITIREGGRETRMSKAEIIAKSLTADALKGDGRARLEILRLDDQLFDEGITAVDGPVRYASPEPVDFDILRDFFMNEDKPEDGGDDDGA